MTESVIEGLKPLPQSPYGNAAVDRLYDASRRQDCEVALSELFENARVRDFLGSSLGDCPFLLDLAARDIRRLSEVLHLHHEALVEGVASELDQAEWGSRPEAMAALRKARQKVALSLGLADLAGLASVNSVTELLTRFADSALAAALRFSLAETERQGKWRGTVERSGFFVLAMGKYGAGELNYSSDIDLIALFDPGAEGLGADAEPSVFWVRIVRTLVTLLQERTADGYVFRVDLRLRPDPAATAVAISAPAALVYYESMGQNWERAAMLKARPCAGDIGAGESFLNEIAPFIWRKYLDFAAIADIHSIKRQTHAHRGHADVQVLGHDIKRGRGGIREIEFFVQTQQLIAGGRDRDLRGRRTREMLAGLASRGWISPGAKAELDAAYLFLRRVEHRLQMVRDEQTHTMPSDLGEVARIARLMGYADAQAFATELRRIMDGVARRYSELFETSPALAGKTGNLVFTGGDDDPGTLETLRELGFLEPETVTRAVRAWHFGRFAATRSTAARESLTELTPALLQALSEAGNPDAGLRAFDALLQALPAGAQLFSLLARNPQLLATLATILAAAPRLAETFGRRPHVVDALIDPASFLERFELGGIRQLLQTSLSQAGSYEDALNRARLFVAEHRFLISVRLLTGGFSVVEAGCAFADVAEAVVDALFGRTLQEFEQQHGRLPGGAAVVLAFGRLGSREMTASSDLDLIIIYDHDAEASSSDGKRPLAPSQYYARLTQRLVAALSAPTAEGSAYAVDLRLRPSGQKGPLATHIEGFERYQAEEAWTWEHMAVARGRPVAGDLALARRISGAIEGVVARPRDRQQLAVEVADMRSRIEAANPQARGFDVKLAPGGLIDCEFLAQYLMLSGLPRREGEPTIETLRRGISTGMLTQEDGATLVQSVLLQSAILHALRIAGEQSVQLQNAPEGLRRLLAKMADSALGEGRTREELVDGNWFDALIGRLEKVQVLTREVFKRVLKTDEPVR